MIIIIKTPPVMLKNTRINRPGGSTVNCGGGPKGPDLFSSLSWSIIILSTPGCSLKAVKYLSPLRLNL